MPFQKAPAAVVCIFLAGLLAAIGICPETMASPVGERLVLEHPEGYVVSYKKNERSMLAVELVPEHQTPDDWTEMLTIMRWQRGMHVTPEEYFQNSSAKWRNYCGDGRHELIDSGTVNGFPFTLWLQTCPINHSTGMPEWIYSKAIGGTTIFAVVQKSWKSNPTDDEVRRWMRYFETIRICNPRLADQSCPNTTPQFLNQ